MQRRERHSPIPLLAGLIAFAAATAGGLLLSRLLFEGLFPAALWLGKPLPAMAVGLAGGGSGWWLWRMLARRTAPGVALLPFLPFFFSLAYLPRQTVAVGESRLLLAATLWLAAVLLYRLLARPSRTAAYLLFLVVAIMPVYLFTLGRTVGRADTFEFQVTIPRLGIVHPTGYPLYLLLTRLFTLFPLGSVAWRANLATAIYGVLALLVLYLLVQRLSGRALPALFAALALGVSPTFWSQAIEAEVYTLHALVVGGALLLMISILILQPSRQATTPARQPRTRQQQRLLLLALAFLLGLGLTNHLTTVLLLPAALLTLLVAWLPMRRVESGQASLATTSVEPASPPARPISNLQSPIFNLQIPSLLLQAAVAFLLPLLLYAYLPLRWAAVNGEPMGMRRFLEWVLGGRFQGALQLQAWLQDPARYAVVGRLLLAEWQPSILLLFALIGLLILLYRHWPVALILLLTWLGFVFYGLNYYVPDLNVFLLPAQLVLAICWGVGVAGSGEWLEQRTQTRVWGSLIPLLAVAPLLLAGMTRWQQLDRSQPDGRVAWAEGVLAQPLEPQAAILADSEKFPPLYYLQQAEGVRPDLEIMVLPDEAAYRQELGQRLAQEQTVYLARYLPGLEGTYHLRSAGPLVEVGQAPHERLPQDIAPSSLTWGPVELLGYDLAPVAAVDAEASALTLYWQAAEPVNQNLYVYVRWHGDNYRSAPIPPTGQHPANNSYPTIAWDTGEIVPDYHLLPRPLLGRPQKLAIEVALAPPFADPQTLPWQAVTAITVEPPASVSLTRQRRDQVGSTLLEGASFPAQVRPQDELPLLLDGYGAETDALSFALRTPGEELFPAAEPLPVPAGREPAFLATALAVTVGPGKYDLVAYSRLNEISGPRALAEARCGWFSLAEPGCVLGTVEVSGVPLPEGATNFDDKIALLDLDLPQTTLRPGGQVRLETVWQALAPMAENYTVFVQIVNAEDRIVGQVDSWPLQGTYPTGQWAAGEVVRDPYGIPLSETLGPGPYRLLLGWYLLETQQRLPVLDAAGTAVDDKVTLSGLEKASAD